MYLSKRKNGNHYYLSLVKSVRVNGQVYKKTVKQFGRIDLLDPQFVKELEEQYAKQKLSKQLTAQKQRDDAVKAVQKLQQSAPDDSHFNKAPLLRYGHLPLKTLWEKVLGLKYKLDRLQDKESDITAYKINAIAFYLTALKVLDPKSYWRVYQAQSSFLYNPISGIALDNIYAALTFLHKFKDEILSHAVKKINEHYQGEPRLIFYDCTNCYFESPYDDKEQFIHNYTVKVKRGLEKAGDTLFIESNNSGAANIGVASAEGRGSIKAGTLEMSNVDLSEQFTDMIVTQRGFQSNARTITTADQMLQEVIALKR